MAIIESRLDIDDYKFKMAQFAWKNFSNAPVKYGFKNRTMSVKLFDSIDQEKLIDEIESTKKLKFRSDELDFLHESKYIKKGLYKDDFLKFLKQSKLPPVSIEREADGQLAITTQVAPWPDAIFWETMLLNIVTELYGESMRKAEGSSEIEVWTEGERRLKEKVEKLLLHPKIKIMEFGTRRRYSRFWQWHVLHRLINKIPDQIIGTSNMALAKEFGIPPKGTQAHELYMIMVAIFRYLYGDTDKAMRDSQQEVVRLWDEMYGEEFSIFLPDTYGTDFFLSQFTKEQAQKWKGSRQDSGSPIEFGEKIIKFYESLGIDPKTKVMIPSDGLNVEKMIEIYQYFDGRIQIPAFGLGTNLMNDMGLQTLSLVVKPTEAYGFPLVKLSDDLSKNMGGGEEVERHKTAFQYTNTLKQELVY